MKLITAKEAAKYLRISLFTLARIEKEGLLVPFRTPGGHRRYSVEMLNEYLERSRSHPRGNEKKILVVDDGEEVVDVLARTFPTHRLACSEDLLQVGMKLAEFKPDLVLVNTRMAGLDGLDLVRRLNQLRNQPKVLTFEAPRKGERASGSTGFVLSNLGVLKEAIEGALEERPPTGSSDV